MKPFRLPRKVKKSLRGTLWLYPADEKGNSVMAFPTKYQKDYTAIKQGIVRDILNQANAKERRKAYWEKLNKPISVLDEELSRYVDDIIRKDLRRSSFNTLIAAKNHPNTAVAYYNFVNAYQLYRQGDDSFGNTCCMAIDRAAALLKKHRKSKRR